MIGGDEISKEKRAGRGAWAVEKSEKAKNPRVKSAALHRPLGPETILHIGMRDNYEA
jgi:hypothetical protein